LGKRLAGWAARVQNLGLWDTCSHLAVGVRCRVSGIRYRVSGVRDDGLMDARLY